MTSARAGTIYTETIVHAAPTEFQSDAPYQIAIVELDSKERITVRITGGQRVRIGDRVIEAENSSDAMPRFEPLGFRN